MLIIEGLEQFPADLPHPVMAIGVFDGLHRGHQAILKQLVRRARSRQGTPVVLTFDPHPQKVISQRDAPPLLLTSRQKELLIEQAGVEILARLPFTRKLSLYSPEKFAREILHNHGIREIQVGSNFRFGHRRSGTIDTLRELGRQLQFQVTEVEAVRWRGERISSTRIRQLLLRGSVALAKRLLGRPYRLLGTVVRGAQKGAELGFPTANLAPENELIPARGVYATRSWVDGQAHDSVTNIGYRPTVQLESPPLPVVESHLFDYHENLYGKNMELDFCLRLRAERKFGSIETLKERIALDAKRTRTYRDRIAGLRGEEPPCPE